MSKMYYTNTKDKKAVGQVHSLGKDKGYHFTWCMLPLAFNEYVEERKYGGADYQGSFVDEYGKVGNVDEFICAVEKAKSQSFDEHVGE